MNFLSILSSLAETTAPDTAPDMGELQDAIVKLINGMWAPCVAIASALAVAWGLYLGIKYWLSAGDEQKKKSAKSSIISFVVGIVVIFVVAVGAPIAIASLTQWAGYDAHIQAFALSSLKP